jgi:hypothetical protein
MRHTPSKTTTLLVRNGDDFDGLAEAFPHLKKLRWEPEWVSDVSPLAEFGPQLLSLEIGNPDNPNNPNIPSN